ncbi:hypothetical protein M514_12301 [Trichuris suis]|uniref:Transposase zinc-ribbon domain-containing protein n=1 Tax=Trichuris suis TaxID=68888 RepID=A0A085MXA0_9BILA|nr:hypothetical protein M513_12301 [Trichuris suis]KFD61846.1 hypothetical protein M514_12301 [Trichuris suis]
MQPSSVPMNIQWLFYTIKDEESVITLLRDKGLLHRERVCPSCNEAMQLGRGGQVWRCYKRSCRTEVSIRTGTWFEGTRGRLKLRKAVQFMDFWSCSYSTVKMCKDELGTDKNVTCRWNRYMREVAAEALGKIALPLHLCESMWRKRLAPTDNAFEKMFQDIANLHPPQ